MCSKLWKIGKVDGSFKMHSLLILRIPCPIPEIQIVLSLNEIGFMSNESAQKLILMLTGPRV